MGEPVETTRAGSAGRWTRRLLIVSLALNLATIGLVAGAAYRFAPMRGDVQVGPGGAALTAALHETQRKQLRRTLHQIGRGGRDERRAETAQMLAALRAGPFDPGLLSTLMSARSDRHHARQTASQAAWTTLIAQMSDDERAAYADRIETLMRRWKGSRGHGGKGAGKPGG